MMNNESQNISVLAEPKLAVGKNETDIAPYLHHWRCHRDPNNVQWWLLDQVDSSTNTLSQEIFRELDELVTQVEKANKQEVRGVVIRSIKKSGFIAGADIRELRGLNNSSEVEAYIARGAELFDRLEKLKMPTIALIHGFCLGGGLELALACNYRIARTDSRLGFPEVRLGLHPALGGSARLCRLIRPTEALNLMLTGKPISAKMAKKLGLVDAIGEERHFLNAVEQVLAGKLPHHRQDKIAYLMRFPPIAQIIANVAKKNTRKKVKQEHYPAPFALIDVWRNNSVHRDAQIKAERISFAKLLVSEQAQNLIRVFFLREALKSTGKRDAQIKHVHLVGAGVMGGEIAAWCAAQGFYVTIEDRAAHLIAPAVKQAHQVIQHKLHNDPERQAALDRFVPDPAGNGRKNADLIIEAVPEKVELKRALFKAIEGAAKRDAIIATNSSSIVLEKLRDAFQYPDRFMGLHFFNPVVKMQLVEIVTHDQNSPDVIQRAQSFVQQIDRLPVAVKSAPGFLVNRVLTPYLLEALALIDAGHSKESIDHAGESFGMPMGPVELADFIGLDICLSVAETLHEELKQTLYPVPQWFKDKVKQGKLGKKSNAGLYQYKKGKPQKQIYQAGANKALQDRLILPMVNTAMHCLDEGIVEKPDHLDGAVIFATGFAPFTGGPLRYSQMRGIDLILKRLEGLQREHGNRFAPAKGWKTRSRDNLKPVKEKELESGFA